MSSEVIEQALEMEAEGVVSCRRSAGEVKDLIKLVKERVVTVESLPEVVSIILLGFNRILK